MIEDWIRELKREAESTRLLLERLPEDKLSWRPHPRSMSLGQLALHAAGVPGGLALLLDEAVSEAPVVPLPEPTTRQELLEALELSVSLAGSKLREWGEDGLRNSWKLVSKGETILEAPRIDMARTLMFNHVYHHRGQLTVYLRLLGISVPGMYGPSADDQ
ncbi:damage-inducible protein DinB [Paenibacillus rhizosphaerae]|uniref:Damage-inducible protein DinB n=1 Tax=Paenibacillus rhizosphaerae TaxID=297318 RepID=A0A1R1EZG4_9BACL|nr:DinB family protein [Paenibacillus rhizosphaerae]OMF57162.1 damage-inducible protein DinB [Paenibacillus rhizosphaerae]